MLLVQGTGGNLSVTLNTRRIDDVTVVDAAGQIVMGEPAATFRNTVRDLAANGHRKVVLNLASLSYVDSCGVGELVAFYTSLAKQGGSVKLLNPTNRVRNLIQLTGLHAVFQIFDDESAAVRSFS
jgi:anti-sigma B factor antagonist